MSDQRLSSHSLHVAVGVIINSQQQILITRRAKNVMQGNKWEFPGGKVEQGETVYQALCRELREEVTIQVEQAEPFTKIQHTYKEAEVILDVWKVTHFLGEPIAAEGQPMRWVGAHELDQFEFPAANREIILQLKK